jgi:Arc/MetJ family transcription regulator
MRTTLDLDADLLRLAQAETGVQSKTALVEMGLRALVERQARKRLKALFGTGPRLSPVRRRT